eukprot:Amastigsp_a844513_47.p1 type:complete len:147 gc:universal Amastigsp_a844513_47:80-520(+)
MPPELFCSPPATRARDASSVKPWLQSNNPSKFQVSAESAECWSSRMRNGAWPRTNDRSQDIPKRPERQTKRAARRAPSTATSSSRDKEQKTPRDRDETRVFEEVPSPKITITSATALMGSTAAQPRRSQRTATSSPISQTILLNES